MAKYQISELFNAATSNKPSTITNSDLVQYLFLKVNIFIIVLLS